MTLPHRAIETLRKELAWTWRMARAVTEEIQTLATSPTPFIGRRLGELRPILDALILDTEEIVQGLVHLDPRCRAAWNVPGGSLEERVLAVLHAGEGQGGRLRHVVEADQDHGQTAQRDQGDGPTYLRGKLPHPAAVAVTPAHDATSAISWPGQTTTGGRSP